MGVPAKRQSVGAEHATLCVDMNCPDPSTYNFNSHGRKHDASEEDCSLPFTRLFYFWADDLLRRGFRMDRSKAAMRQEDLMLLPADEEAIRCYQYFKPLWLEEIQRVEAALREEAEEADPTASPRLFWVLFRSHMSNIMIGGVYRFIADGCSVASPFMLRELINWLTEVAIDPEPSREWEGYTWALSIALIQLFTTYANNASSSTLQKVSVR